MKLRALESFHCQKEGRRVCPGDVCDEHDVHARAALLNGHAEPAAGESVLDLHRRLHASGIRPLAPRGGGAATARNLRKPRRYPDAFAGWEDGRGPAEQALTE